MCHRVSSNCLLTCYDCGKLAPLLWNNWTRRNAQDSPINWICDRERKAWQAKLRGADSVNMYKRYMEHLGWKKALCALFNSSPGGKYSLTESEMLQAFLMKEVIEDTRACHHHIFIFTLLGLWNWDIHIWCFSKNILSPRDPSLLPRLFSIRSPCGPWQRLHADVTMWCWEMHESHLKNM